MVSAYQRNWGGTSDDSPMGQSYEKQYQVLRVGAIPEENRRKLKVRVGSSLTRPLLPPRDEICHMHHLN